MKKHELNAKILEQLADKILADMRDCEEESRAFEVENEDYFISGSYNLILEWEDQTFSHEFGKEYCGEWKLTGLEDLDIDWIGWVDEYNEDHELEITNEQINYMIKYINKNI